MLLRYSFSSMQFSSSVGSIFVQFHSVRHVLFNSLINGSILLLNNLIKEKLQQRSTVTQTGDRYTPYRTSGTSRVAGLTILDAGFILPQPEFDPIGK